ncbi:hypothetical protein GQ54DRAFT_298713, partial [Martensiomyces pterosporus]
EGQNILPIEPCGWHRWPRWDPPTLGAICVAACGFAGVALSSEECMNQQDGRNETEDWAGLKAKLMNSFSLPSDDNV